MKPFLYLVAEDLYKRFGEKLNTVRLVFPNRRSILFFKKYLSEIVQKPVWAPGYFTVSDFFGQYTNLSKANDLLLNFMLYKAYSDVRQTGESFDNFYYWGEVMLSDFDDIDKYLVDTHLLFKNLAAYKNINETFEALTEEQLETIRRFWQHFEKDDVSKHQHDFSSLWIDLEQIYSLFKERLRQQGFAYEGMIYRDVAESVLSGKFESRDFEYTAFIGFNALTEAENVVYKHFAVNGKTLFYWDYYAEMLQEGHESGFFITENVQNFKPALNFNFPQLLNEKKIECVGVPSEVGQAKLAGNLVKKYLGKDAVPEETAILLTDERLLPALLSAIPSDISDVNITMGYPAANSSFFSLIEVFARIHLKNKPGEGGQNFFNHKDVFEVLMHPLVIQTSGDVAASIRKLIVEKNQTYIVSVQLRKDELLSLIFSPLKDSIEFVKVLQDLSVFFANEFTKNIDLTQEEPAGIEQQSIASILPVVDLLQEQLSVIGETISMEVAIRATMKSLRSVQIPFEGEPLRGLQVMGFLESRALDFENIIILGFNEGKLPKNNFPVSFIPYSLRRGFKLPTMKYRDAMYAYYFYRLLHRAKNVTLLYNSAPDSRSASEISRYALQLQYLHKMDLKYKSQSFAISPGRVEPIEIVKDATVIAALDDIIQKRYLSPSALSTYIDCPLKFYYRYIKRLKPEEEVTEDVEGALIGLVVHAVMQHLYKPYIGQLLSAEIIDLLIADKKRIQELIHSSLLEELKDEERMLDGKVAIIKEVIQRYVIRVLEMDKEIAPVHIRALEQEVIHAFQANIGSEKKEIKIGGKIDRIDEAQNIVRIVDYKTGNVAKSFTEVKDIFAVGVTENSKKEIFQTGLYALIASKQGNLPAVPVPCLYALRSKFDGNGQTYFSMNRQTITDFQPLLATYEENFLGLLKDIWDMEKPFAQTTVKRTCEYCDYKQICHK